MRAFDYSAKRMRYSKLSVFISCLFFGILIGAIANIVMAFAAGKACEVGSEELIAIKDASLSFDFGASFDINGVIIYAISGAVIGIGAGLVAAIIICIFRSVAESKRNKKAEDIRACLEPVRHVIADGRAIASKKIPAIAKSGKKGTLFLTETTLEFYDVKYTKARKNFLLKLSDVVSVKARKCLLANNKIIITTGKAKYTFKVPMGTARKWKKQIKKLSK